MISGAGEVEEFYGICLYSQKCFFMFLPMFFSWGFSRVSF